MLMFASHTHLQNRGNSHKRLLEVSVCESEILEFAEAALHEAHL